MQKNNNNNKKKNASQRKEKKSSSLEKTFKVGFSPSKRIFYLLQWKPFKNNEKYFLFHLKSSFGSQDI